MYGYVLKEAFYSLNLGAVLPGSPALTYADFDLSSNSSKSSHAHLSEQKRTSLGKDLDVI